jgi:hypothetical protein
MRDFFNYRTSTTKRCKFEKRKAADALSCRKRARATHLDEQRRFGKVERRAAVFDLERDAFELLQVLLQLGRDVDVPIRGQVPNGLEQVGKAVLPQLRVSGVLHHGCRHDGFYTTIITDTKHGRLCRWFGGEGWLLILICERPKKQRPAVVHVDSIIIPSRNRSAVNIRFIHCCLLCPCFAPPFQK